MSVLGGVSVLGGGPFAALAGDPANAGLFCDFDGTLAPIVDDPADARPLPGMVAALGALAERLAVVAVVSGRPAAFLAEHLAPAGPGVRLVGLYGLELVTGGAVHLATEAEPWLPVVAELADRATAEAPAGVRVEAKGATLVLHWRGASDRQQWGESWAARWSAARGLVAQPGRMSVELRPPVAADKGTTIEHLAAGCRVVGFAGDDAGDLAAFDALDRMAVAGAVTAIRVAIADVESPPELVRRADTVLDGPAALQAALQALVVALR